MRLLEDLASLPLGQPKIIQQISTSNTSNIGIPLPPKEGAIIAPLPTKKNFKGSIEKLEMLIEVKSRLLNRFKYQEDELGELVITDILYLDEQQQKQFEEEITKIRKQITKIKGE